MQYTTFVLILSSRYISGGFSLVDCNPCLLMCRCTIVVFLDLSRRFLMSFYVRPGHVFRKSCLTDLRRLSVVGLRSAACKYWDSYGFEVCDRMLYTTFSDCCGPRGTSHFPVFLFLVPFIISSPFLWVDVSCLSSVMVHSSSYRTPNYINGDVYIFGKIWICLACLLRTSSWSVAIYVDSIVIPSGSLASISFSKITVDIVRVACLDRCIFAPESVTTSMLVLFGSGGVSI